MANVKVFQKYAKGRIQGHVFKIYGTMGKVLLYGTHMPNIRSQSLKIKKVMANF